MVKKEEIARYEVDGEPSAVDRSIPLSLDDRGRKWFNALKRLPTIVDISTILFNALGPWLFFYVTAYTLIAFLLIFQLISILQGLYIVTAALRVRRDQKQDLGDVTPSHFWVLIMPNYKEDMGTLRMTLDHYAAMDWAKERFLIVLGMEGGEAEADEKAKTLEHEYEGKFKKVTHSIHPRGLPGETSGKHSNEKFAGEYAHKYFVEELFYDKDTILVTSMDADTLHRENYFKRMELLMREKPERKYNTIFACPFYNYQNMYDKNVPRFNANFDQLWACLTMGVLARSSHTFKFPASSYTIPLRFLKDLEYWDGGPEALAEDEHMAIKALFATNGNLEIHTIYEVMNNGTVFGDTWWNGIKAKLVQLRRHFQSNVDVAYAITMLRLRIFKMPFVKTFQLLLRMYELFFMLTMAPICGIGYFMITLRVMIVPSLQPEGFTDNEYTAIFVCTLLMNLTFVFIICIVLSAEIMKGQGPETHNTVPGNRKWWHIIFYLWMLVATVATVLTSIKARFSLFLDRGFTYVVAQKTVQPTGDAKEMNGSALDEKIIIDGEDSADIADIAEGDTMISTTS